MINQKILWECNACGHAQSKWTGSCQSCSSWNSFVKKLDIKEKNKKFLFKDTHKVSKPIKLSDAKNQKIIKIKSNISEIDRLLGGGVVPGGLFLIAGEPGIGKSTLLLQLSNGFTKDKKKVLYITAEESIEQTSYRAERLNINSDHLFLLNETNFEMIKNHIDEISPDVIIADSVQVMYKSEIPSSPGSIVQIKEITTEFMHLSKGKNISTFLIGHVTKAGDIAGPRLLEHLVDVVLEFEGDKQHGFRVLRSIKNRFGATDDIALFQMTEKGLMQIENPSSAFLTRRIEGLTGSCIGATIEGMKTFLIEIQALVSHSFYPNPIRKCIGLDQNRLAILLAVMEKKLGYKLFSSDVFVSIAGGIKILEPAIDLGIVFAIASSFSNRKIDYQTSCFGEIGLGGEIRPVLKAENRIKEAINMGFSKCIIPKKNIKDISKKLFEKIEIIPVSMLNDAVDRLI